MKESDMSQLLDGNDLKDRVAVTPTLLHEQDEQGNTLLHHAICKGDIELVKVLLPEEINSGVFEVKQDIKNLISKVLICNFK